MLLDQSDKTIQHDVNRLIERARAGDEDAFAELMARHYLLVRRTAYTILKNADDADDVTQDVTLNVLRKLHCFKGQSAFSTWLTRIAINVSLMHLRKARRRHLASLDQLIEDHLPFIPELFDHGPCPEQQFLSEERRNRLHQEILRLPSSLGSVLMDHVYLDIPIAEVAERQGLSRAAARSRAFRAIKMLSRNLNRPHLVPRSTT